MMIDAESLTSIATRAANAAGGPARVFVFGSYARGDAKEDSDLDLLVIEPKLADKAEEYLRLRSAIGRIGVGVDLLLYSEAEFTERSQIPGTLPYWAAREGKLLHERRT